ncbi:MULTISPECIES: cytochrome P450 [Sphingomonadales]|uniref:Cytochrome P450 n=1 Tax=Rhizorhapis suberifaciens TaxID=13656 RepID=A0A840HZB1_9SPHN|nr:cytochrome P450 [Rhizorhapis suberifaciens]MBB4642991.1 cytochrome P450 [Rhizorhapis suberifaciens]
MAALIKYIVYNLYRFLLKLLKIFLFYELIFINKLMRLSVYSTEKSQSDIPRIKSKLFSNNSSLFRKDPLYFLSQCHYFSSCLVEIDDNVYVVTDPGLIEAIFHEKDGVFVKSRPDEDLGMVNFPASVMNSAGENWRRKRKSLQPGFHLERVERGVEKTVEIAERHLAQWGTDVLHTDVRKILQLLCLDVGSQYLFGTTLADDERASFVTLADAIMVKTRDRKRFPIQLFDRAEARLTTARHNASGVARAALARTQQWRLNNGRPLVESSEAARDGTDDWLCDEFCAMVLSGLEPMAAALAWTLHLLTLHPDAMRRVTGEVDVVASTRGAWESSGAGSLDLAAMAETMAALKEALRLFPPAWLTGRIVSKDTTLGGFFLGEGSALMISPWVNHRSARHFDLPGHYRPERWLDGKLEQRLPRYAFFPFGGGSRRCIGDHFSMTHMMAILFCILRRFALNAAPGAKVRPYPALVLRPMGIAMILTHRAADGRDR